MGLHADAVTGAVDEVLAVPGVGDDLSRRPVDVLTMSPHHTGGHSGGVGVMEHGVRIGDLGGWPAEVNAASDVAAVTGHRAAEVAQHDVALGDNPSAGVMVRRCRVFAGSDDGEVHCLVPLGQKTGGDVGADLRLRATPEGDLAGLKLGGHPIGCGTGGLQGGDFGGVLAHPQGAHHFATAHIVGTARARRRPVAH